MAAPALTRWAWPAAAFAAAAFLAILASYGQRPEPGLARFEPAGVMRHVLPERVAVVEIQAGTRQWRFTRVEGGWTTADGARPDERLALAVEQGLKFLSVSAPQRVLEAVEVEGSPAAEFGLAPPRYTVRVQGADGESFSIAFGDLSHQRLAQYAQVEGRAEIVLLPRFVGDAWETAADLR